jgi:hypothetical protein
MGLDHDEKKVKKTRGLDKEIRLPEEPRPGKKVICSLRLHTALAVTG